MSSSVSRRRAWVYLHNGSLRHGRGGHQKPAGVRDPLFDPAPLVAAVRGLPINAAAVSVALLAGHAVRDAARVRAVAEERGADWGIVPPDAVHEGDAEGISSQDPGDLVDRE